MVLLWCMREAEAFPSAELAASVMGGGLVEAASVGLGRKADAVGPSVRDMGTSSWS